MEARATIDAILGANDLEAIQTSRDVRLG